MLSQKTLDLIRGIELLEGATGGNWYSILEALDSRLFIYQKREIENYFFEKEEAAE